MNLIDAVPAGAVVALDTMVWIYELEAHPEFGPIVRSFFRDGLEAGRNRAGSSLLTLGELLVQPLSLGRLELVDRYRRIFTPDSGFAVWEVTRDVVETAAALRAKYRLRMLDALHVASALVHRAGFFVTNDEGLRRVNEVKVLILSDLVAKTP
jgi:uncharacterized protein